MIKNPILPGFNPDPCIVRKDDDYYIVVSSFEWMPGLRYTIQRGFKPLGSFIRISWQKGRMSTLEASVGQRNLGAVPYLC